MDAVVELPSAAKSSEAYVLVCYRDGKEIRRQPVAFVDSYRRPRRFGRVTLDDWPSEVALLSQVAGQPPTEVARARVEPPAFEAEAVARPDVVIHPVDLGTILPPADWLLLAGGQPAEVEVAALSRHADVAGASADRLVRVGPGPAREDRLAARPRAQGPGQAAPGRRLQNPPARRAARGHRGWRRAKRSGGKTSA